MTALEALAQLPERLAAKLRNLPPEQLATILQETTA